MAERTSVAIVEDQRGIREGLRLLIDHSLSHQCTASFASMAEALPALSARPPDIVLMGLGLSGMDDFEGIRRLKERHPDLHLIALTICENDDRLFQALCAAASGYRLKTTAPPGFVDAVPAGTAGGASVTPDNASRVIGFFRQSRPPAQREYALTPHEVRLLQLLAEGHSYKTAAAVLGSSSHTVAFHMKHIYTKLQVHSKTEAVAKALREHIVS